MAVSWVDWRDKKIKNSWSLINIVLFVLLVLFWPTGEYSFSLSSFYYPLGTVVVGFILFLLKQTGAGDSKFLATFFLLIPHEKHGPFFWTLMNGIVICFAALALYRIGKKWRELWPALWTMDGRWFLGIVREKTSFAPIILFSWVFFGYSIKVWSQ